MNESKIFDWMASKVFRGLDVRGWIECWKSGTNHGEKVRYEGAEDPGSVLPVGRSGVRIGRGVDLGVVLSESLAKWGCPAGVLEKVRHAAGWTGAGAIKVLHEKPVRLEESEAEALTRAVWHGMMSGVVTGWNSRMPPERAWDMLTEEMQMAAAGLVFRFGWTALDKRPALRVAIQAGQWRSAGETLRGGNAYWGDDWMAAYEIGHMMDLAGR